jgi:hypothetical protein
MKPPSQPGNAKQDAIDDTVSRALNMLAHTAPPAGMEARILNHLRHRSESGPSTFARRLAALRPQLYIAGALACLVAAVVMLSPAYRQPAVSAIDSSAAVSPWRQATSASGNDIVREATPARRPVYRAGSASRARLVSFPAPPAPLTEQERLLLAVAASHPSPDVIAALDPVQRAEATARSERQFLASLEVTDPNASTSSGDHQ